MLPDKLTPQDRELCTKSWRPTLIPITSGSSGLLSSGGPLYQTADGRKLPALVQVMSGGKPYHISINDYNRMCIIRREKIMNQKRQAAASSPNGGNANAAFTSTNSLSIIPMPKEKEKEKDGGFKAPTASTSPSEKSRGNKMNIPNQILEQNSLIPIESNGRRHQNGSAPPPLKGLQNNILSMSQSILGPSALANLSKAVNNLQQPSAQLEAWKALWNETDVSINNDNMAALATIANLANFNSFTSGGGMLMDTSLLSKIPKSLTVIPQAKTNRRSNDEQTKHNSAST